MTKKLPFAFTKPIIRYIETILKYYNDNKPGQTDEDILPHIFIFETYLSNELFYDNYEKMRWEFVNYLEKNGAGTFTRISGDAHNLPSRRVSNANMSDEELPIDEEFKFEITDISTIKEVYRMFQKMKEEEGVKNDYSTKCKIYYEETDVFRIFGSVAPYLVTSKKRIYIFKKLWDVRTHTYNGNNVESGKGIKLKFLINDYSVTISEKELKKVISNFNESLEDKFAGKIEMKTKEGIVTLTITETDSKK